MKKHIHLYALGIGFLLTPAQTKPVLEKLLLPACVYSSFKLQNPLAWGISTSFLSYCFLSKVQEWTVVRYEKPLLNPDPRNTIFAFDFHDVLVTPDFKKGITEMRQAPHKLMVIKDVLKPWFLFDLITLFNTTIFEDMVNSLADKYPDIKPIRHSLFAIGNAQVPITGTFEIIKLLKQQGYKIYLFSNIGEDMFKEFTKAHPNLFDHFDQFFVTQADNDYIHKPNPKAYELFLSMFNLQPQQVIFIDNSLVNISVADSLGIHGILFESVPQLYKELQLIGAIK